MEDMPGTINTPFFCNRYIDFIIKFKDLSIERERINIYKTNEGYKINQFNFINKIIEKYGMNKIRQIKVPCIKLTEFKRENSNLIDASEYKFLLASRESKNPTEADYKFLLSILQYLKCTKNKSIYYSDEKSRRLTSGYIFLQFDSFISIAKHKIRKSSIPLGIKPKRIFLMKNINMQQPPDITKFDEIPDKSNYYKTLSGISSPVEKIFPKARVAFRQVPCH
ncbi:hypothetical protein H8356DRAFT_1356396 [Neocallimastix lanati (nom. inval.)]|nr:hypothetical protein H8356DRAFT_1356396 [Neocallimastix sp. JGI-2020a]